MSSDTRYVVGYDLNDIMTQISYFEVNTEEPETLVADGETERFGIPTILCKRQKVSQWSFGNEARHLIDQDGEAEVSKLLMLAKDNKSITIEGEEFAGIDLLILFVRKSLNLLSLNFALEQIKMLAFTVPTLDKAMISVLERVAAAMPIAREKIFFQSYSESIYCYMLHQPAELWEHEVAVFDHDGHDINCYHMKLNRRTTPTVGMVDEYFFDGLRAPDENDSDKDIAILDDRIYDAMHDFLMPKMVKAVYLIGDGFEGEWCKHAIHFLCMGRRVFQGKNMYSKGACYAAKDRIVPFELNDSYVFLGKDKLQFNLGMKMLRNGVEEYIAVADGGENWFDVGNTMEFLLVDGSSIKFLVTPLDGKEIKEIEMVLDGLPVRPPKATRLRMLVTFESGTRVKIHVEDMGFGEIFPASGMTFNNEIDIV